MANVYVLADACLRDAEKLTALLQEMAGGRYAIESVSERTTLHTRLTEAGGQAVVVFSAEPHALAGFVQRCRKILPGTAFVAVAEEADVASLPVFETDCHFLVRPYDRFELLNQLSASVRQSELLAALAGNAQVDEVTNLFNRSYFLQRLSEEISLSRRHLSPLCCVILGVNFYQMYLDSYGYDFINALLRHLADKIGGLVRHEDIIARIGDDELAILLPRSTEKGAKVFTNRLVQTLNQTVFQYGAYEEEISVCAGVAGFPLPEETEADADMLVRYGRHALHQARCTADEAIPVFLFSEINPSL